MTKTIIKFNAAAIRYTDLQPHNPAMIPLINLENKIPVVIPEATIPTICPLCSGLLKSPANGNMICPEMVTIPMLNNDKDNIINEGDKAHASKVTTDKIITMAINLFLRTKSPSGTMKKIPKAYPIWVAVTSNPPLAGESPKAFVISTNKG